MEKFESEILNTEPEEGKEQTSGSLESGEYEVNPELNKLITEGAAERFSMETGGKTVEEYKKELGSDLDHNVCALLRKVELPKDSESVELVLITLPSLDDGINGDWKGPRHNPHYWELNKYAQEKLGLDLCEPQDGMEFFLKNNKRGVVIAMKPIVGTHTTNGPDSDTIFLSQKEVLDDVTESKESFPQILFSANLSYRNTYFTTTKPGTFNLRYITNNDGDLKFLYRLRKKAQNS